MWRVSLGAIPVGLLGVAWLMSRNIAADKKRTITTHDSAYSMVFTDQDTLFTTSGNSYVRWNVRRKTAQPKVYFDPFSDEGSFPLEVNLSASGKSFWGGGPFGNKFYFYSGSTLHHIQNQYSLHTLTLRPWDIIPSSKNLGDVRDSVPFAHGTHLLLSSWYVPVASSQPYYLLSTWNLETHQLEKIFSTPSHTLSIPTSCAISPNERWVAVGTVDALIDVYNLQTGKFFKTLKGHVGGVASLKFSPDSRRMVSGGTDKFLGRDPDTSVRVWDVATGQSLATLYGVKSGVTCLQISHDGTTLAAGHGDGGLDVWNITEQKAVLRASAHAKAVKSLAFTPDDSSLATAGADNKIKLWPLK